jgi:hypothetical protein
MVARGHFKGAAILARLGEAFPPAGGGERSEKGKRPIFRAVWPRCVGRAEESRTAGWGKLVDRIARVWMSRYCLAGLGGVEALGDTASCLAAAGGVAAWIFPRMTFTSASAAAAGATGARCKTKRT